jgi:hypothetical protein
MHLANALWDAAVVGSVGVLYVALLCSTHLSLLVRRHDANSCRAPRPAADARE